MDDLRAARVEVDVWRPVECGHVYGLSLQLVEAAGLDDAKRGEANSADRLPDHVNALEAL
jgi:hypothetical protein